MEAKTKFWPAARAAMVGLAAVNEQSIGATGELLTGCGDWQHMLRHQLSFTRCRPLASHHALTTGQSGPMENKTGEPLLEVAPTTFVSLP